MITVEEIRDSICICQLKDMDYAQGAAFVATDIRLLDPTPEQTGEFATGIERVMRGHGDDFEKIAPVEIIISGRKVSAKLINPLWIGIFVDGEEISSYGLDSGRFGD